MRCKRVVEITGAERAVQNLETVLGQKAARRDSSETMTTCPLNSAGINKESKGSPNAREAAR